MNNPDMHTQLQLVHTAYCDATGTLPNFKVHERVYAEFVGFGFTADDMALVLQYLTCLNRRNLHYQYSLRLDKLLDFEFRHFDSLLQEARAHYRNAIKPDARRAALKNWRGMSEEQTKSCAKQIGEIIKSL